MKKRFRLRRRADFQRTMAAGRVYAGRAIVAFASEPPAAGPSIAGPRVGVTVSRRLRGAVARNRARRRVREAVRLFLLDEDSPLRARGIKVDVVLIARPGALALGFDELAREVRAAAARVMTRTGAS